MIEVIKKKINLENFKSRVPGLISVINQQENFLEDNASWGKIPITINILGKNIKYGTIMDLYYKLLDIITKSIYYGYSLKQKKWIKINIDWRDILKNKENVRYRNEFYLNENEGDDIILGITSLDNVNYFYDNVYKLVGEEYNGFDFFEKVNSIIGKEIVPYFYKCRDCGEIRLANGDKICEKCKSKNIDDIQETNVPYFIYLSEVNQLITFMEDLKLNTLYNCCESKKYKEYGGDVFYEYLLSLKDKVSIYYNVEETPTIDIPILLTSKLYDSGTFRTYNVDIVDDIALPPTNGDFIDISTGDTLSRGVTKINPVTITSGESKLLTLRKRKRSVDINGNELPGIYNNDNNNVLEIPYEVGYIKNVEYYGIVNNKEIFHGDMIVEMNETAEFIEQTKSYYDELVKRLPLSQYIEGGIDSPIKNILKNDVNINENIVVGVNALSYNEAIIFLEQEILKHEISLKNKLLNILKNIYNNKVYCLKQDYEFTYNIIYDGIKETHTKNGTIHIVYNNPQIEITYVLGGTFKKDNNGNLILNEDNPYKYSDTNLNNWSGSGIWYKETFPMKKNCVEEFNINGDFEEIMYDMIDFENKENVLNYKGIDFPRKKYIFCENIIYQSEAYKNNATSDAIFKDEKMLGINFPIREKYDVLIDRGSSAAFEKHLQLSEIKTWQDLENYRNGMFFNK